MQTSAITLYQTEERLAALLNTEDLVPAEQLAEFSAELTAAGEAALDKRDGVIRFHQHVAAQIAHAAAEEKRIAEWRASLEAGLLRFEGYVARVIEQNVPEPKKGVRKLQGRVGEIRLVRKPGFVVINDEDAIPERFLRPTHLEVRVPTAAAGELSEKLARLVGEFAGAYWAISTPVADKNAIKKAIDAGEDVPGADVTVNQFRLEVK